MGQTKAQRANAGYDKIHEAALRLKPTYADGSVYGENIGAAHTVSASLSGGEPSGSPKPSKRLPSVIKRS